MSVYKLLLFFIFSTFFAKAQPEIMPELIAGKWTIEKITRHVSSYHFYPKTGVLDFGGVGKFTHNDPNLADKLTDPTKADQIRQLLNLFVNHSKSSIIFNKDGSYSIMFGDTKQEVGNYKLIKYPPNPFKDPEEDRKFREQNKPFDFMKGDDKYFIRDLFAKYEDGEVLITLRTLERKDKLFWYDYNYRLRKAKN